MAWRFQQAKHCFCEVVKPAHSDLLELIRAAPDFELLDLERARDPGGP